MNKKIRVLTPIEIPGLSECVDMDFIRLELNNYIKVIVADVNIQDLADWKLLISVTSRATSGIGVFKKAKRYPSDKEFEISISIPIPNNEETSYGLSEVNEAFYLALNDKSFHTLKPDFENYETLSQYLLASSKRAIDLVFTNGFTCNGKKIKFQK